MLVSGLQVWTWALALFLGLGAAAYLLLRAIGHRDPSFARRYLVQGVLIVLALAPPWFGGQTFGFALAAYACAAAHEVSGVLSHVAAFVRPMRWLGALGAALACLVTVSVVKTPPFWVPLTAGVLGMGLPWLLYASRGVARTGFAAMTCALWPGVALAGMAWLATRRTLAFDVAFLFGVLEVSDSVAYVIGRAFGKHRLWPAISQHKTWEGSLAGIAAGTLTGYLLAFAEPRFTATTCAWLAAVLACLGVLGDLSASAVKRTARVKDFNTWLGLHGGFVDAYDSFVLVAPFWCAMLSASPK